MRVRAIAAAILPGFVFTAGIYHNAWPASCPTHSLLEIAAAVKASKNAPTSAKSRSCMWGGAAQAELSGGRLCAHNSNNFGVLQLSRQNLERLGITPAEYMAESLQEQIDVWAQAGAAQNNQSRGYKKIDRNIDSTLRFGHVMDGVLAACSQFGPAVCNNDIDLIENGKSLPLRGGGGGIPCKTASCPPDTVNQDGNGQTIISWGLVIEGEIHNSRCVD